MPVMNERGLETGTGQPGEGRGEGTVGYQFGGVQLDLRRGMLRVDGIEQPIAPLLSRLLQVLCEANGAVLSRGKVIEHVWPRQVVSDEALTRLISRARELLGPYGDALVTARRVGLRLDLPVQRIRFSGTDVNLHEEHVVRASPHEQVQTSQSAVRSPEATSLRRPWLYVLALTCVLTTAGLWAWSEHDRRTPVMPRFGLVRGDLQFANPETIRLLGTVDQAWNGGSMTEVRALLTTLVASDPGTPVPSALLSIAEMQRSIDAAKSNAREARKRSSSRDSPYVNLLVQYVERQTLETDGASGVVDALLRLRPSAWYFRLRAAHAALSMRRNSEALSILRDLPLDGPGPAALAQALADRAGLGDMEAVLALDLEALFRKHPTEEAYLQGRLAWSKDDPKLAIVHFDRMAAYARSQHQAGLELEARTWAAVMAYSASAKDAGTRLADSAARGGIDAARRSVPELLALAAEISLERGDRPLAEHRLNFARPMLQNFRQLASFEIFSTRLGLLSPGTFLTASQLEGAGFENGEDALIEAWWAQQSHQRGAAQTLLGRAYAAGIMRSHVAEDAQLLSAVLGRATPACKVDPPYPNILRFSSCRAMVRQSWRIPRPLTPSAGQPRAAP